MDPAPAALHWVRSGVDQIFLGQRDHVERGLSDYRILGLQARHTVGGLLVGVHPGTLRFFTVDNGPCV
jgi:hypothetical protein